MNEDVSRLIPALELLSHKSEALLVNQFHKKLYLPDLVICMPWRWSGAGA